MTGCKVCHSNNLTYVCCLLCVGGVIHSISLTLFCIHWLLIFITSSQKLWGMKYDCHGLVLIHLFCHKPPSNLSPLSLRAARRGRAGSQQLSHCPHLFWISCNPAWLLKTLPNIPLSHTNVLHALCLLLRYNLPSLQPQVSSV